jgi:hypothetical protein
LDGFEQLARLYLGIAVVAGCECAGNAVVDVVVQDLVRDPLERRRDGNDLSKDVDAVAEVVLVDKL